MYKKIGFLLISLWCMPSIGAMDSNSNEWTGGIFEKNGLMLHWKNNYTFEKSSVANAARVKPDPFRKIHPSKTQEYRERIYGYYRNPKNIKEEGIYSGPAVINSHDSAYSIGLDAFYENIMPIIAKNYNSQGYDFLPTNIAFILDGMYEPKDMGQYFDQFPKSDNRAIDTVFFTLPEPEELRETLGKAKKYLDGVVTQIIINDLKNFKELDLLGAWELLPEDGVLIIHNSTGIAELEKLKEKGLSISESYTEFYKAPGSTKKAKTLFIRKGISQEIEEKGQNFQKESKKETLIITFNPEALKIKEKIDFEKAKVEILKLFNGGYLPILGEAQFKDKEGNEVNDPVLQMAFLHARQEYIEGQKSSSQKKPPVVEEKKANEPPKSLGFSVPISKQLKVPEEVFPKGTLNETKFKNWLGTQKLSPKDSYIFVDQKGVQHSPLYQQIMKILLQQTHQKK